MDDLLHLELTRPRRSWRRELFIMRLRVEQPVGEPTPRVLDDRLGGHELELEALLAVAMNRAVVGDVHLWWRRLSGRCPRDEKD
jgi:hypothetical protein